MNITTTNATTTNATTTNTAHRSLGPSPVRTQSLSRLFVVELRKTVDTRAGRMMLGSVLVLSLGIAVWGIVRTWTETLLFSDLLEAVTLPVVLLLPVVGVLAMTSEWSQRTALTTFTLSPRRVRVLLCKLGSSVLIGVVATAITVGITLVALPLANSVTGAETSFDGVGGAISNIFIAIGLNVIMGAAFGALISITPAALVAYFAAPLIWGQIAGELLGDSVKWLDITAAIQHIAQNDLAGVWPQTLTSIAAWIVVPLVAGLAVSSRREVK